MFCHVFLWIFVSELQVSASGHMISCNQRWSFTPSVELFSTDPGFVFQVGTATSAITRQVDSSETPSFTRSALELAKCDAGWSDDLSTTCSDKLCRWTGDKLLFVFTFLGQSLFKNSIALRVMQKIANAFLTTPIVSLCLSGNERWLSLLETEVVDVQTGRSKQWRAEGERDDGPGHLRQRSSNERNFKFYILSTCCKN